MVLNVLIKNENSNICGTGGKGLSIITPPFCTEVTTRQRRTAGDKVKSCWLAIVFDKTIHCLRRRASSNQMLFHLCRQSSIWPEVGDHDQKSIQGWPTIFDVGPALDQY